MSASSNTRIVAQGYALRIAYMDSCHGTPAAEQTEKAWQAWEDAHGERLVQLVKKLQDETFDACLRLWDEDFAVITPPG